MKHPKLDRMAELLKAALKAHFEPGQPIKIPKDHPLWADLERAIRAEFGGQHISIPSTSKDTAAARNKQIIKDRENGLAVSVIVDKYGLSRAAVYKILDLKKRELSRPK